MWRDPELAKAIERTLEWHATKPDPNRRALLRAMAANPEALGDDDGPQLDVPEPLFHWIGHIGHVAGLLDAGCSMRMDDLRPEEWDGVRLWRAAEASLRRRYMDCPGGCGRAIRHRALSCGCGWVAKR